MDDKAFFERFDKLLEIVKTEFKLTEKHDALILWFAQNYYNLDAEDIAERIVTDSHAEGVDGIFVDNQKFNLIFIQAETCIFKNIKNSFSENKLKLTLEGVRFLLKSNYKQKITPELENYTDEYHELDKSGNYKTKVIFIILKEKPSNLKFIEDFNREFPEIEVIFHDFNFIKKYYEEEYLVSLSPPPEKISFQVITNILKKDTPFKARVFTAKAEELARLYNDYKERIFQQNVRYSLGLKSRSINEQILDTAKSSSKSKHFWYFNNGINIVCKELKPTTNEKIINLFKPQIINGAQTTYSLYEAFQNGQLQSDTEVLIRAVETSDKDFTDLVTLYTNSQNAIRLRDLCSNDDIQTSTQKILKDTYKYFYERKRGEFESSYPTKATKEMDFGQNYMQKVINNEKAAQAFLAMYLDMPSQAKSQKVRLFMKDEGGFYKSIFNPKDQYLPEKFLMSWILLNFIEEKKRDYKTTYNKAEKEKNEERKQEIYAYDFLLHSEYFILNLFKDFLKEKKFNLENKDDLLKLHKLIKSKGKVIKKQYKLIIDNLKDYINELRKEPTYYHNKFFKSEKNIALVRNFLKNRFAFIELLT